ncbi:MAG: hypothetical protein RDV41_09390, partial [Planctomycetota bacterium]|nr:hypothetical protein [Planctomycetota bacterium]
TFGFLFTLASMLVCGARSYMFRNKTMTQLLVAFVAGYVVHGLCGMALAWTETGFTTGGAAMRALVIAAYSAPFAPVMFLVLGRPLAQFMPRSSRRLRG